MSLQPDLQQPLPPATHIKTDKDLIALAPRLASEPLLAVDTESNSLYAYREQVCLFQVSSRAADYIIDPLTIGDMSPMGSLLANPAIEKVFHAGEYDLMCMKRDYGFEVRNLFDTMIAARIVGRKAIGLNALIMEHIGIELDKSHQLDDWGKRPLSPESLRYAQMDTYYLPSLRDKLKAEIEALGYVDEANEAFADLAAVPAGESDHFDPEGYWRIGQPRNLGQREMAILRELYLLRERLAEERDEPPFKVFGNDTMIVLAKMQPRNNRDLSEIRAMSEGQKRRYGSLLLQAIAQGVKGKTLHAPPRQPTPDPIIVERYMALRDWRKERARKRGVESDVILPKDTLWDLARKAPRTLDDLQNIHGLRPWRLSTYGVELLEVIQASME